MRARCDEWEEFCIGLWLKNVKKRRDVASAVLLVASIKIAYQMENCEENIMLDKITFEIGGFFSGYQQIKIWKENGVAYKSYRKSLTDSNTEMVEEISKEELKR